MKTMSAARRRSLPRNLIKHTGGCHCGRVKFEVTAPAEMQVTECNCSICSKSGYLHLVVPKTRFKLVQGSEFLTTYTFNTGVARHLFCSICGIKSFYVPRSNPDGFSVNVRCLDEGSFGEVRITDFDGRNWEAHGSKLAELSRPPGA